MAIHGSHGLRGGLSQDAAGNGLREAAEHLKKRLGVGFNETTPDGLVTLKEGECFGACGDAPVMLVNNKKMASFMTPDAIDKLLAELK
jgi:NADH-quinone oxidoreductase subunit E